jgi:hypothetical protein
MIKPGILARLPGYASGWPVISHVFDCTATLAENGHFDIALNIRGINFATDPSTMRVFAWDGKRYSDVSTNLDLVKGVICARVSKPSTLVIMSKVPLSAPTKSPHRLALDRKIRIEKLHR